MGRMGRGPTCGRRGRETPQQSPYGQLPYTLFEEIRAKFIGAIRARRAGVVPRSE
jgi:hypothetical protein